MPLWLSQWTTIASSSHSNNPESNFLSYIPSQATMLASMYSASTKLNATDFCFLLNQDTTPDPTLKQQPEVLFRFSTHPDQSASVKPANCTQPPTLINQSILHCTSDVAKYVLCSRPVHSSRVHHELTQRVVCKDDVWSSVDQIHKRSNKLAI